MISTRLPIWAVLFCASFIVVLHSTSANANAAVEDVLDQFHHAAAQAKTKEYFDLLSDDVVFMGTDAKERWNKAQLKAFAKPYFEQGRGWLYVPISRHITAIRANEVVFFDELLTNKSYGTCRGSGVVINTDKGWKILQYNLSIMVPNDTAKQVTSIVKAYEKEAKVN